jgi:hypothetical protein
MKTECRKPVFHTGRHTYLILYSARDMPTNDEQEHTTCSTIRRGPSCPLWDSLSEAVAKCRAFLARFKGLPGLVLTTRQFTPLYACHVCPMKICASRSCATEMP